MASETYVRGDFLANRGVPIIDDENDLCPGRVGGQIVPLGPFTITQDGTASATKMTLAGNTIAKDVVPFKAGSVIGMSVRAGAALASGCHATFYVYKGATATTATATIPATGTQVTASKVKDAVTFAAGKALSMYIKCASLTTDTFAGTIFVEQ